MAANRPVFVVAPFGSLVSVKNTAFKWYPGFALVQKQKNIHSLHQAYIDLNGDCNILEISTKSELELGVKLSAFNLTIECRGKTFFVESAFQGSKVFECHAPFVDLLEAQPSVAKRDARLHAHGDLIGFEFDRKIFPTQPPTFFYDWLYIQALSQHEDLAQQILEFDAFTDIEFNPKRSINCQARSAATFVSLARRNLLKKVLPSKSAFQRIVYGGW